VKSKDPRHRQQIFQAIHEVIQECATKIAGQSNMLQASTSRQRSPSPLSCLSEVQNVCQTQRPGHSVRSQRSISAFPPSRPTSVVQGMKNSSAVRPTGPNLPVKEPFEVCKGQYRQAIFKIFIKAEERSGRPLEYASIQRKIFLADWAQGMSGELLGRIASELFDEYAASRHARPTAWSNDTPLWEWTTSQIESRNFDFTDTVKQLHKDPHRRMSRKAAEDYLDFVLVKMHESGGRECQNDRLVRVQQGNPRFSKEGLSRRSTSHTKPAYPRTMFQQPLPFPKRQGNWPGTKQAKPMRWRVYKEKQRKPPLLWRLSHWF
jgi:hypothetical protein